MRHGLDLKVSEGRFHSLCEGEDGSIAPSQLSYQCFIRQSGTDDPEAWMGEDATIVITGVHENGRQVTISGKGIFGADERNLMELCFDSMPTVHGKDLEETGGSSE